MMKSIQKLSLSVGDRLPAFRSRNYRLYFAGQSLSMTGNFITQVTVLWLIYRLTDSALLLGISGFLGQLPVFVLAPVAGLLADRYHRHRLMLLLQLFGVSISIVLTVLTFLNWINFWVLLGLAMVGGVLKGLDVPIRHAFVTDIVSREEMSSAISLNYAFLNSARFFGPALGGIAISTIGAGYCFLYDSLSYIAVIVALSLMQVASPTHSEQQSHPWKKLQEGFRYAYDSLPIRALLLLLAMASLLSMSYPTLLPIFTVQQLQGGPEILGFLSAAAGFGSLLACIYLSLRRDVGGLDRLIAVCPATMGISIILFAFSHIFWLSVLALVLAGCSSTLQVAASNTVMQAIVDNSKRGRVMSFYTMCFMGMAPFGNLLLGSAAQAIGAPNTLKVAGILCILGSLLFIRELPQISQRIQLGMAESSTQAIAIKNAIATNK
jgi:MFS family permease